MALTRGPVIKGFRCGRRFGKWDRIFYSRSDIQDWTWHYPLGEFRAVVGYDEVEIFRNPARGSGRPDGQGGAHR